MSSRIRSIRWRYWLGQLLLFAALLYGLHLYQTRDAVSGAAPALAGELLSAEPVLLADSGGRPTLVHFWATWCPVCGLEQGSIDGIAADQRVISVAMQSGGADEVSAYLREQGVDYPVLLDPDGTLAAQWGVRAVPASFVIDPAGQIRFRSIGFSSEIGLRLRLWWASL